MGVVLQLGATADEGEGEGGEGASVTSSDAMFENHNVWLKGMRSMMRNLSSDAEQVRSLRLHQRCALCHCNMTLSGAAKWERMDAAAAAHVRPSLVPKCSSQRK